MKKSLGILGSAVALFMAASSAAFADTAINLAVVTSDAVVDSNNRMIPYQLQVTVDDNGDLTGMTYYGNGNNRHYTLAQVNAGAVLKHDDSHNLDVVTLYGSGLDARNGGAARLHFLTNGITGSTDDFGLEIQRVGSSWLLYTDSDHGHRLVRSLFMKKNTFFGRMVGIDSIEAN